MLRIDDTATPGQRLERLRTLAGHTRETLAAVSGCSPETIKSIELGRRSLSLRMAQRLAPHLDVVDLAELYGPTVRMTLDGTVTHEAVPELRRALTSWPLAPAGDPQPVAYLRGALDAAWRTWHTSRTQRSEAGAVLPALLDQARRAARAYDGQDRRQAAAILAQVYHLAQAYLAWHGDRELVWLSVGRGMDAAMDADDPVAIAQAVWYTAHVLRAVGRGDEAQRNVTEAVELVAARAEDDVEAAATLADLHLCNALTAARAGDQSAWHDWATARRVVERLLPDGYVHPWTRVGRVLVDVYACMLDVELGRPDEAHRRAAAIDPATIPSTERRARHYVELARGADQQGSPEGALHLLGRAEATSPETVRYSPPARDIVGRMLASRSATIRADVEQLAARIGLPVA